MSKDDRQQDLPRNSMQVKPVESATLTAAQREAAVALERARAAQESRRKAPMATGNQRDCKATQAIERISAKYGGQLAKGGYYFFFDDGKKITELSHKGVEVAIEDGDFVRNDSDILYMLPTDLYYKQRSEEVAMSNRMIKDVVENERKQKAQTKRPGDEYDRTIIGKKGTPEWTQAHEAAGLSPG